MIRELLSKVKEKLRSYLKNEASIGFTDCQNSLQTIFKSWPLRVATQSKLWHRRKHKLKRPALEDAILDANRHAAIHEARLCLSEWEDKLESRPDDEDRLRELSSLPGSPMLDADSPPLPRVPVKDSILPTSQYISSGGVSTAISVSGSSALRMPLIAKKIRVKYSQAYREEPSIICDFNTGFGGGVGSGQAIPPACRAGGSA
ncbi:hypothetical protein R3P38DRAFT_2798473 [Favolaschia claudopus]|uniref:Uncharacterized protein n=1 Tax=Favolaschia claudopus TaxID=2862362 RepID=A0AAW0A238_9AGAR